MSRLVFCEPDILEFVAREEHTVLYVNSNISFSLCKLRFSSFPFNENRNKNEHKWLKDGREEILEIELRKPNGI